MVLVRIPRRIVEKPRCAQVCIPVAMMRELGVKRKAAYVSISTRLPWLLAPPPRIFPPRLFSPSRLASPSTAFFSRWRSSFCPHCVAALPSRHDAGALSIPKPLRVPRLLLLPVSLRELPAVASAQPFDPDNDDHTFLYRQYIPSTWHYQLSQTNFSRN